MNLGVAGLVTFCLLDYNRPIESELCLRSLYQYVQIPKKEWKVLYLSNGGRQDYCLKWYNEGLIDNFILNKQNWGCGIAMKQMAQAVLTEWVIIIQTDQYLCRPFIEKEFLDQLHYLINSPDILYIDLAGNQGNGNASERAFLINRKKYLELPQMENTIGGPGPFAQFKWTEKCMQENCKSFISALPLLFANNGAWSEREYGPEYGNAITKHRTDTKKLLILSPFSKRADGFPNLNLTDYEWEEVLSGKWPKEGKIPEMDKKHSFVVWPE